MLSQDQIFSKVSATLVDALNVDEEEIKPDATLQGDLGAESIDFLDIVFRLEREFGIKIPRGELFPESIFQGDPDLVQNGRVTDKGLAELRTRMPFADLNAFEKNPEVTALGDLFTVEMIALHSGQAGCSQRQLKPGRWLRTGGAAAARRAPLANVPAAMRWIWIDRFVEFHRGKAARAVKNLSLAEDHFADHFPGFPVMPAALILEGLAQTGGILVGELNGFREKVVLAKIPSARFFGEALAGDQLIYDVEVLHARDEGASVLGKVSVVAGGSGKIASIGEAEIFFAYLDQARSRQLFGESNFVFGSELRLLLESVRRLAEQNDAPPAPATQEV